MVTEGKKVFELHVTARNKGDAVAELKSATDADVVIFVGDDSTDESVFERLDAGDIGIKVGEGVTAAEFRIPDIEAVARLLEDLVGVLS
jgi:trehalose 6-phosphate phosphatase